MLEEAIATTKTNGYENVVYARWADDYVILVNHHDRSKWIMDAIEKRLTEEIRKLGLKLNQKKTKIIDLKEKKAKLTFMGFVYRMHKTKQGKPYVLKVPDPKSAKQLRQKIKKIFHVKRGRAMKEIVPVINPILRGWVNYYRIGNAAESFSKMKDWVEKKVRRHERKQRQQPGFAWKKWSSKQLYERFGIYNDYQIRYSGVKV